MYSAGVQDGVETRVIPMSPISRIPPRHLPQQLSSKARYHIFLSFLGSEHFGDKGPNKHIYEVLELIIK